MSTFFAENKRVIITTLVLAFLFKLDSSVILFWNNKFKSKSHVQSFLDKKRVWITGASSGVGKELALQIAANSGPDTHLLLSSRRKDLLEDLSKSIQEKYQVGCTVLDFDAKSSDDVISNVVQKAVDGGGLDIVILNHAIFQEQPALDTPIEFTKELFKINYESHVQIAMNVIDRDNWKEKRKGHLVVTASAYGRHGGPYSSSYAASKHALVGFFQSLRVETEPWGLRIDMVLPGPLKTEMHVKEGKAYWNGYFLAVSAERCANLMLSGITGTGWVFYEVWIGDIASLICMYSNMYLPVLGHQIIRLLGFTMDWYHADKIWLWK